jgi:acetyl-CoA synthase
MDRLKKVSAEMGMPNFPDMIADETVGTTEDEILPFLTEKGHPALTLPSLF